MVSADGRRRLHARRPQLRTRLENADADLPSTRIARASLERLTFHAAIAERLYRALVGDVSPILRAHAELGLASLYAQSARYLRALSQAHAFEVLDIVHEPLRTDQRVPVAGLYLLLRAVG